MALVALLEGNTEVDLPGLPGVRPIADCYLALNTHEDKKFQVGTGWDVAYRPVDVIREHALPLLKLK